MKIKYTQIETFLTYHFNDGIIYSSYREQRAQVAAIEGVKSDG